MNKKGQTLVEVVVALGILTVVFAAVITLISQVVHFELSSRNTTIATNIAQKKLAEAVSEIGDGCISESAPLEDSLGSQIIGGIKFSYETNNSNTFDYKENNTSSVGFDNSSFMEIVVKVTWEEKNLGIRDIILKQVVKK